MSKGQLVGLHVRVSGQSINAFVNPALIANGKDDRQLQGYTDKPGDAQLGYTRAEPADRVRDAQHARAGRALARRQHQPERRVHGMLHGRGGPGGRRATRSSSAAPSWASIPKHLAVLNAAADKGDWGKPLAAGVHRGIAQFMGYGSYSAAVAEVSVSGEGTGQGPPHGAGAQLRPCGQSRPDRRPGRGLGGLWSERRVLRRVHGARTGA